jgi:hypothetical protein
MGAVEGATFITDTYIDSLSFQQLVSCDTVNGQDGCNGGSTVYAMDYAVSNSFGGLTLYSEYPFVDSDGTTTTACEMAGKNITVEVFNPVTVASYSDSSTPLSERIQEFKQAVAQQPVSITMNANCDTLQSYSGGVLTSDGDCSCQDVSCIDHAVLLVGYDDDYNPPYWYIKNSWVCSTAFVSVLHGECRISRRLFHPHFLPQLPVLFLPTSSFCSFHFRARTGAPRGTFTCLRREAGTGACSGSSVRASWPSRPRTRRRRSP